MPPGGYEARASAMADAVDVHEEHRIVRVVIGLRETS